MGRRRTRSKWAHLTPARDPVRRCRRTSRPSGCRSSGSASTEGMRPSESGTCSRLSPRGLLPLRGDRRAHRSRPHPLATWVLAGARRTSGSGTAYTAAHPRASEGSPRFSIVLDRATRKVPVSPVLAHSLRCVQLNLHRSTEPLVGLVRKASSRSSCGEDSTSFGECTLSRNSGHGYRTVRATRRAFRRSRSSCLARRPLQLARDFGASPSQLGFRPSQSGES